MESMPAMELLYLDGLAAHLLGEDAPVPPYTVEHGTGIATHLLRAVTDARSHDLGIADAADAEDDQPDEQIESDGDVEPDEKELLVRSAREAVVEGAHRFADRGGPGVHHLVSRFLGAAVGELEQSKENAETQVRALFYFGMLAIASGPENEASAETAEGVLAAFSVWDERIGAGYVPPWRIIAS